MKKIIMSILFLFIGYSLLAQSLPQNSKLIKKMLDNGLVYQILPTSDKGKVYINIRSKIGTLVESPQELAMAHFLEHMLFKGSKNFPDNSATDILVNMGLTLGQEVTAYTSETMTTYNICIPSKDTKKLDISLSILYDWMENLTIDSLSIENEKSVVKEEIKRAGTRVGMQILTATRHSNHTVLGTPEQLDKITVEGLRNFYHKYYRPDMITVIVAGDVDVKLTDRLIKKHFEVMKKRSNSIKIYDDILTKEDYAHGTEAKKDASKQSVDLKIILPELKLLTEKDYKKRVSRILLSRIMTQYRGDTKSLISVEAQYIGDMSLPNMTLFGMNFIGKNDASYSELVNESLAFLASLKNNLLADSVLTLVKTDYSNFISKSRMPMTLEKEITRLGHAFASGSTSMDYNDEARIENKLMREITVTDIYNSYIEILNAPKILTYTNGQESEVEGFLNKIRDPKGDILFCYKNFQPNKRVYNTKEFNDNGLKANTIASKSTISDDLTLYKLKNNLTVVTYANDDAQIKISVVNKGGLTLLPKSEREKYKALQRSIYNKYGLLGQDDVMKLFDDNRSCMFSKNVENDKFSSTLILDNGLSKEAFQLIYQYLEIPEFSKYGKRVEEVFVNREKQSISEEEYVKYCKLTHDAKRAMKNSIVYIGGTLPANIDELIAKYLGNISDSKMNIFVQSDTIKYPVGVTTEYNDWVKKVAIVDYRFKKPITGAKDIKTEMILIGLERVISHDIFTALRVNEGLIYSNGTTYEFATYPDAYMGMSCRYMIDPNERFELSREITDNYLSKLGKNGLDDYKLTMLKNVLYKQYRMYYYDRALMDVKLTDFYLKYGKIYTMEEAEEIINSITKPEVNKVVRELIDMQNYVYFLNWPKDIQHLKEQK